MTRNHEQINEACNQLLFAAGETARLDTLYHGLKQESYAADSQKILAQQAIEDISETANIARWGMLEVMATATSIQEQYGDVLAQSIVMSGFAEQVKSRLATAQAEQEQAMKMLRWRYLSATFHSLTRSIDFWDRHGEREFTFDPGATITIKPHALIPHRNKNIEYGLRAIYKPSPRRFTAPAEIIIPLVDRDGLPLVRLEAIV